MTCEQDIKNIQTSLGVLRPTNQNHNVKKVLSIHLQSNRPRNLIKLFDNLCATADDLTSFEVIVKIDDHDEKMNLLLANECQLRPFTIKYISTPLSGGFFDLWSSMNDILRLADPDAYFYVNFNDEMIFETPGWDTILKKYIGLFPDHIFRLRTSKFRFRNYYDFWECGFAPETSAITTSKWIKIGGNWNPCLGPDTFQQCVAFYFGYMQRFHRDRFIRDIPINDILIGGEGAGVGLSPEAMDRWMRGAVKSWYKLMSYEMQLEAANRAAKLYATVWLQAEGLTQELCLIDDQKEKCIRFKDAQDRYAKKIFKYRLNPLRIFLVNTWRLTQYFQFGGGGDILNAKPIRYFIKCLTYRFNFFLRLHNLYKRRLKRTTGLEQDQKTSKRMTVNIELDKQEISPAFEMMYESLQSQLKQKSINLISISVYPNKIFLKINFSIHKSVDTVMQEIFLAAQQISPANWLSKTAEFNIVPEVE